MVKGWAARGKRAVMDGKGLGRQGRGDMKFDTSQGCKMSILVYYEL